MPNTHMKYYIKEKALKLEFTESEVGTLIKDILVSRLKTKLKRA